MFDLTLDETPFFLQFLIGCKQILFKIKIHHAAWEVFDFDSAVLLTKCLVRWMTGPNLWTIHLDRGFLLLNWCRLLILLFEAREVEAGYLSKLEHLL